MGISKKSLASGEQKIMTLREHWKALLLPVVLMVLIIAAAIVGAIYVPESEQQGWYRLAIAIVAVILAIWLFGLPYLRWSTTTYTFTNRRLITRSGIINRSGRDIPLYRINDISFDKDLIDRMFGCGTLIVHDASEQAGVRMHDIPNVEKVQVMLQELLHATDDATDEGDPVPTEPAKIAQDRRRR